MSNSSSPSFPKTRCCGAITQAQGRIYLFGGKNLLGLSRSPFYKISLTVLQKGTGSSFALFLCDFLLLFSGQRFRALYEFDPWTGIWSELFRNPSTVRAFSYPKTDPSVCADGCSDFSIMSHTQSIPISVSSILKIQVTCLILIAECSTGPRLHETCGDRKLLVYSRGKDWYVLTLLLLHDREYGNFCYSDIFILVR